jgi:molybdopterin molybdotransferase
MPEPTTPLSERPWEDVTQQLDVDTALTRILAAFSPLPIVDQPLLDSCGQVLGQDVIAQHNVPPFRNSAMDGYAIRAFDASQASWADPATLRVVGHIAAGQSALPVIGQGEAARIMTGAPLPEGADTVVRFEETDERPGESGGDRDAVRIFRAPKPLDNVREAGEDIAASSVVAHKGKTLRPADIGLLASVGWTASPVHRRPVVSILSTGNEVNEPGNELSPGAIRDSNSYVLAAYARQWGADVKHLGIARDTVADLTGRLTAAREADLIVTSGGVSLGDFDFVKDVLRSEGDVAIWQVRMKPGKPLAFGHIRGVPLLGLPGNPVAAAVSFILFGRPIIRRMLGCAELSPRTIKVKTLDPLENRGQRRHYVRAVLDIDADGSTVARIAGEQGAGILSSLAAANALVIVPESLETVNAGTTLDAILIDE